MDLDTLSDPRDAGVEIPAAQAPTTTARRMQARPDRLVASAAALCFVLYPALRPASSETGLEGAAAFSSWQWTAAHVLGMVAFVGLAATVLLQAYRAPVATSLAGWSAGLVTVGVAAILPYYGAETFGLAAIGAATREASDATIVGLSEDVRNGVPALTMFGLGLAAIAIGGALIAVRSWRVDSSLARAASSVMALGLVTYLPQFFLPTGARVLHGAILGVGLVLWVWTRRPDTGGRSL